MNSLKELSSDRKVAFAIEMLQKRLPSAAALRSLAKELTPIERGQVLLFAGPAKPALVANGFADAYAPHLRATTTEDRARLLANAKVALPPLLAQFLAEYDFAPRVAAIRAGKSGVTADEKGEVRNQLDHLDASQMKALREMLVERPPHPQLKRMAGHWALKGPPTLAGLLSILSGEPLGLVPEASDSLKQRARSIVDVVCSTADPSFKQRWIDFLQTSDIAVVFAEAEGTKAFEVLSKLGLSTVEVACGADWGRHHTLVTAIDNAREGEVKTWVERHGAEALGRALAVLERSSWQGPFLDTGMLVRAFGFEHAVGFTTLLQDPSLQHGLRALRSLEGADNEALIRGLIGKSEPQIRAIAADAAAKIPAFGAGMAPLYSGATWPPLQVQRTAKLAQAEAALLAGSRIDPQIFASSKRSFSSAQLSWVADKMRRAIWEKDPSLLGELDRELQGRRFVSFRYYDELYNQGVKNPEHRYSVETFDSWQRADHFVLERAIASRGRPLAEGELIAVMREVHALVARGMIEVGETHMKESDLGRLRSSPEDHVQLGNGIHRVGANTLRILRQNPYLQSFLAMETMVPDEDGKYAQFIAFSEGKRVPELVRELELFVRENEGKLPPEKLAAEIHFRMVSIHPFMDGNGRTSKLIADFILARAGIRPPVWREGDVMKHQDRWAEVVRSGVEYDLATVERYFRRVVERA